MRSYVVAVSKGFTALAGVFTLAAVAGLTGCGGGESTGDDAYSQKFEAPEGAKAEAGPAPEPYSDRRAEIEKAQGEPLERKAGKSKR